MDESDIWNRRCDGLVVANDSHRSIALDMEITRSLGDVLIARLLRRDQDDDRARMAARLGREPMGRCDDPRREVVRLRPRTRVKR
jgi:hypothetical protein